MSLINHETKEINFKIVYFGCAFAGKATNLQFIHNKLDESAKGELISLKGELKDVPQPELDTFLFFPCQIPEIEKHNDFTARFHLYTIPGEVRNDETYDLLLKGVDGIVFVADSQTERLEANIESFNMLKDLFSKNEIDLEIQS